MEIGTAVGYSAICFVKASSDDVVIDTIELDEERAREAVNNIKDMGMEKNICVHVGNAVDILPTMDGEYDVIFIDAAKAQKKDGE